MNLHIKIKKYEREINRVAAWFYLVAVLSLINGLLLLFGLRFFIGLAFTDFITLLLSENFYYGNKTVLYALNIVVALIPAIGFAFIGFFSSKKSKAAIITGLELIALDTLAYIILISPDIISMIIDIAFHIIVIAVSAIALNAIYKLPKLKAQLAEEQAKKREKIIQSIPGQFNGAENNKQTEEPVDNKL